MFRWTCHANHRFVCRPYFKPSALTIPLGCGSAHPLSLHRAWPVQYVRSLAPLSTSWKHFLEAKAEAHRRCSYAGVPPQLLKIIAEAEPLEKFVKKQVSTHSSLLWLVLPYDPSVVKHVTKAIARLNNDPLLQALWRTAFAVNSDSCPVVRIAWRRGYRNLTEKLRDGWRLGEGG